MGVMDLRRNILLNEPHVASETGNPVTFQTDMKGLLSECKVGFSPVQEGSGDPSPSNVRPIVGINSLTAWRTGKNLFDYEHAEIQDRKIKNNSGSETTDSSGSYCKTMIPVVPNAKYTFSGFTVNNQSKRVYFLKKDGTLISRSSAYTEPFTVTTPDDCYYCQLQNREVANAGWGTVMFEPGESASTYAPYSGQSFPVTFPALGKNLLDPAYIPSPVNKSYVNYTDGTIVYFSVAYNASDYVPIKENTEYTLHAAMKGQQSAGCAFYDENKQYISGFGMNSSVATHYTFTSPNNAVYMRFSNHGELFAHDEVWLEYGDTATTFEPYTNTCYGGNLDLTTGVLTETYMQKIATGASDESWNTGTSGGNVRAVLASFSFGNNIPKADSTSNLKVNYMKSSSSNIIGNAYIGSTSNFLCFVPQEVTTTSEWRAYLAENPMQIIYELATPITYQLTPQQIRALLGDNTIWSDTNGNTTVKYWSH